MKDKASEIPKKMFCSAGLSIDKVLDLREKLKFLLNNLQ